MAREIPVGSVEIQTGLWLYSYDKTISGVEYTFRQLFSSEGYCFYNNTLPEEERIHMRWCALGMNADVNDFTSVEIEDGMVMAGNHDTPETI